MEMNEEVMSLEQNKIKKRVFIARLTGYLILGLFIPAGFLIWRFNLFQQTSKLNIGGWGIVSIIFMAIFISKLARQAAECVDNEIAKQAILAVKNVFLPLLSVTLCLYAVGDFWKELINFFMILTICEPIAYALNPFPEFLKEKEDLKQENKLIKIIGLFWEKKK